jgi:predicted Zn-dependent protease
MPRLDASDVPHTTQTDHRILRLPQTSSSPKSQPDDAPELYDDAETRLLQIVVARARGLWLAERAERYTSRNFAQQALQILKGVVASRPSDVEVLEALGTCSAIDGRTEEALSYCTRVLAMDPDRERTLLTAATLQLNRGKIETGRRLLEDYLEVQPNDATAWGRYSGLLSQLNETQKAIDAARKSTDLDPSNPRTWSHLAELYQRIGDEQQEEVCRDLGRRVQISKTPQ